jgi:hypothetical protein
MLLIYFSCLAISFILLLYYFKPIYAIFLFIILFTCFEYHTYKKSIIYKDETIPKYNKEELYDYLKHGDVLICKFIPYQYKFSFYNYLNYNLSHFSLIIEENNEKYIVDAIQDRFLLDINRKYIKKKIKSDISFDNWNLVKVPLKEYLYHDMILQVIRRDKNIEIKDILNTKELIIPLLNIKYYYCCIFIGDILSKNNIIKKSTKLFPYVPNELIKLLKDEGFNSFLLIYDNNKKENGNCNKPKLYDPVCPLKKYNLIYLILLCLLYKLKSKYIFFMFLCLFIIIQFI